MENFMYQMFVLFINFVYIYIVIKNFYHGA